jgi:hypothetical protein
MASPDASQGKDILAGMTQMIADGQLNDFLRMFGVDDKFVGGSPEIKLPRSLRKRRAYVVRIDLLGIKPPIWRRLVVSSDLTMAQFHVVIQSVFGWFDGHLHAFDLWSPERGMYLDRLLTRYDTEEESEVGLAEGDVRLNQVLREPGDKVEYTYDFGDDWRHRVRLEKVEEWTPDAPLARCLTGRRARPPEDCGGPPGFEEFLLGAASTDWDAVEPDGDWEWTMAEFDAEEFELDDINDRLESEEKRGYSDETPW